MERSAWLTAIAVVALLAVLAWPLATSANPLIEGPQQTVAQEPSPTQAGAKTDSQRLPYAAYLPIIVTEPPPPAPTPTPTSVVNGQMIGYNIRCQKSGDVQVCAAVCSPYPAPYSFEDVYGMLFVNGVAQQDQPATVRFDFPGGPVTCNTSTDWTGLAICMQNVGGVQRYQPINVHVTISGHSADTFFTPQ